MQSTQITTVYAVLNQKAKQWHYHQTLRRQGRTAEARDLERQQIRSEVKTLRCAKEREAICFVGKGGFRFTYNNYSFNRKLEATVYGYDGVDRGYPLAFRLLGMPVIDTTDLSSSIVLGASVRWSDLETANYLVKHGAKFYNFEASVTP